MANRVLEQRGGAASGAASGAGKNMIYPVKPKMFMAAVAVAGLLCSLAVSGCSDNTSESNRSGSNRSPGRVARRRRGARGADFKAASPADARLAQGLIREHLHAFGRSDFHLAYNLLTPGFQQGVSSEERLRQMMEGFYSDFMHVKKVDWQGFSKNEESGDIKARLTFEASGGGVTRATYILQRQDGRYLIGGIDSYSPSQFNGGSGPRGSRPNEVEEKMFSGVLYSPAPRHRVLDSRSASL